MADNKSILDIMKEYSPIITDLQEKLSNGTITQDEKQKLKDILAEVSSKAVTLKNELPTVINKIVELKTKRDTKPKEFTTDDANELAKLEARKNEIKTVLNTVMSDSQYGQETLARIRDQEERVKQVMQSSESVAGTSLTFTKFSDYYDYIVATRYLNLYYRDRACDIQFKELLSYLAVETKKDADYKKEVKKVLSKYTS